MGRKPYDLVWCPPSSLLFGCSAESRMNSPRHGLFPEMDAEAEVASARASEDSCAQVDAPQEEISLTRPETLAGRTVYAVDANSLIFQVFHAIPEMTSPRGEPVSAVFGFVRDVLFLLEERKPDYLFVAFDRSEPTFRHQVYDGYKAQRSEMPVDLIPQFPAIKRFLKAFGIPIVDCAAYEADDILATIAHETEQLEGECFLVTGDKDCRQLISDRVKVFNVRKNQEFDAELLRAEWGVRPDQVVDFQALVGDSIDNIPGVPLIGPKIARELLEKFDTLDALLARADELPKGKRKDNLIAGREQALISRDLVRLDRQVPVRLDWDTAHVGAVDGAALVALCEEFGFHTLCEKLSQFAGQRTRVEWTSDYKLIASDDELRKLAEKLRAQQRIALATITSHAWPRWAEIVGFAFAWLEGEAWYVPVKSSKPGATGIGLAAALEILRPLLEDRSIAKVGHDLKKDVIVLQSAGLTLAGVDFDTMIASYLLDAGERNHSLEELSSRYLNHSALKPAEVTGAGKNQRPIELISPEELLTYAAQRADIALRLTPLLAQRLEQQKLDELNSTLEVPLIAVLADMESAGVRIDVELLADMSVRYSELLTHLEAEIYETAGRKFNIGSPKQLQQVLFEEHKLPMLKKTKTGGSTDVEVLEELARTHPLPAKIIEYRQYSKLKSTYIDALPQMVHPQSGRVHAAFNQVVAATGRLSASDPNLQNIPIRNEAGREIRSAFRPGVDGWQILAADYSQIELRVLAHFSGDEELCSAFSRDEDVHTRVAAQVHDVPLEAVTSEMRRRAKAVNFGVIYGQSPFGLAKSLNIEQAEAAKFIHAYFDRYQGVERFLQKVLQECQRDGYVSTILGRRRSVRGIRNTTGRQRNLPERTAINTVIQGSAADIIKLAMINIHRRFQREQLSAQLILQIHDELVFEAPAEEIKDLAKIIADEMAGVMPLCVPLKVDVKVGSNWAECEALS